jgi:pimeloyl-ACP methyl ester carboxylesterase
MEQPISGNSIVFIHGLFMNPDSWSEWVRFFTDKGFTCYFPAYPYHFGNPAQLRKHVDPALGTLTFGKVISSLSVFIEKLPEKPILVGHSMGGLAVQKLIEMGKGVAGVCIDSAPPAGIFSFKWSFLKANLSTINPLKGDSDSLPSVKWYQYAFCNTMSLEETKIEFDKFVVPESRNIPRSSTKKEGRIDFNKPHQPLLFIAGEKDHIIPPSLNRKNFNAYKDRNSHRSFREFKDRTHYICGQENWQEVAGFIEEWISELKSTSNTFNQTA